MSVVISSGRSAPFQRVKWDIIADNEVQGEIANTIRSAFDKFGAAAAYREQDGIHTLVQTRVKIVEDDL